MQNDEIGRKKILINIQWEAKRKKEYSVEYENQDVHVAFVKK